MRSAPLAAALSAPTGTPRAAMYVVARVGDERFAFRVADVEEVIDAPKLMHVPNAPRGLAGQFAHRDRTVGAFDAGWMFEVVHETVGHTALVLRVADDRLALLVDDVEDLTALDEDAVRPAPAGTDPGGLLRGVCLPRAERRAAGAPDRRQSRRAIERRAPAGRGARRDVLICIVNAVAVVSRATV